MDTNFNNTANQVPFEMGKYCYFALHFCLSQMLTSISALSLGIIFGTSPLFLFLLGCNQVSSLCIASLCSMFSSPPSVEHFWDDRIWPNYRVNFPFSHFLLKSIIYLQASWVVSLCGMPIRDTLVCQHGITKHFTMTPKGMSHDSDNPPVFLLKNTNSPSHTPHLLQPFLIAKCTSLHIKLLNISNAFVGLADSAF